MKLTPRQIVVRGRELAASLLHALEQERLVARFVDTYAVEFERPVCTAYVAQYRETVANLRREALLAMTLEIENQSPRLLGAKPRKKTAKKKSKAVKVRKPKKAAAPDPTAESLELFHREFLGTLGQMLGWHGSDSAEFQRDLTLYRKLVSTRAARGISRRAAARVEGPFVDRCGVLLDPSMLDRSRLAAARFEGQLHATVQKLLRKLFRSQRAR